MEKLKNNLKVSMKGFWRQGMAGRGIYHVAVIIIASWVIVSGCISAPPKVTPISYDFSIDDLKLQSNDLPEGYDFSDEYLLCPSVQTTIFYKDYNDNNLPYKKWFGVPDKQEYQSFVNPNGDNGSILYFYFAKPLPENGKELLSNLFWGGMKPSREHPEEFFINDKMIVVWCFKTDSLIKKISQYRLSKLIEQGTSGKTFGGQGIDWAYSVQQTSDGGFILAGYTQSYGAGIGDVWPIKTDANGNLLWSKTFGGTKDDVAISVKQTLDGGYVLSGWTGGDTVDRNDSKKVAYCDAWLLKIDTNGNEQWNKTFGGRDDDDAGSVQQTSDGGYILAGTTFSYGAGNLDAWLIKTDSNGNEKWNKTFGGRDWDGFNSGQLSSDGGYILAGETKSYGAGNLDAWLVKTDANGNEQWNKTFGGTNSDDAYSVQQTSDGGYILTGGTYSSGADSGDIYLIKVDANGNEQWSKTFGGASSDFGRSVQQTSDGGYILAGATNYEPSSGLGDAWLIKTDANGNQQWNKPFGGIHLDRAYSVQQISDGSYIIAGFTTTYGAGSADAWLIKVAR